MDTAQQGPDLAVFRECSHIPYACYDSVPHPVSLISLLLSIRYSIIKIPLKFRDFKENRQYFLLFDR